MPLGKVAAGALTDSLAAQALRVTAQALIDNMGFLEAAKVRELAAGGAEVRHRPTSIQGQCRIANI